MYLNYMCETECENKGGRKAISADPFHARAAQKPYKNVHCFVFCFFSFSIHYLSSKNSTEKVFDIWEKKKC